VGISNKVLQNIEFYRENATGLNSLLLRGTNPEEQGSPYIL